VTGRPLLTPYTAYLKPRTSPARVRVWQVCSREAAGVFAAAEAGVLRVVPPYFEHHRPGNFLKPWIHRQEMAAGRMPAGAPAHARGLDAPGTVVAHPAARRGCSAGRGAVGGGGVGGLFGPPHCPLFPPFKNATTKDPGKRGKGKKGKKGEKKGTKKKKKIGPQRQRPHRPRATEHPAGSRMSNQPFRERRVPRTMREQVRGPAAMRPPPFPACESGLRKFAWPVCSEGTAGTTRNNACFCRQRRRPAASREHTCQTRTRRRAASRFEDKQCIGVSQRAPGQPR